ncbi:MAG TPA: phosphate ABC transporter permease PstA [Candidatus Angelobacter sp.]|nr:phosphate ABC transporter permease PstA [Candidatus Angelobacter sp.]
MPKLLQSAISRRRRLSNVIALSAITAAALVVTLPLFLILGTVAYRGIAGLNWAFFTQMPKPPGEIGGGMANALAGSGIVLMVASAIGIPFGIGTGIFLAEYGRNTYGDIVRFTADVLNGVPSIVIGLTAWALVVVTQGHFSALSGGIALGIMMVPTVSRTTEEVLLMVPQSVREAALGLGIPRWRTTLSVVIRTAMSGIVTGIMLAFARVAGETAPLMFTAFGNQFWSTNLNEPIAALPLQIYVYAISPFDEWHRLAWTGAFVLITLIAGAMILFRFATSRGVMRETT